MDFNQSYAEFCNTIWTYFEQGRYGNRKSATYHVWTQQTPAAAALDTASVVQHPPQAALEGEGERAVIYIN